MQATELGALPALRRGADFLSRHGAADRALPTAQPSGEAEFRDGRGGRRSALRRHESGQAARRRRRRRARRSAPGPGTRRCSPFEQADGCAVYPEVEINAAGEPRAGRDPYGEVRGLLDAHLHMMAFEFLGGASALRPAMASLRRHPRAASTAPTTSPAARPRCWRTPLERHPRGRPRHGRLADLQRLARAPLAHPRADLLQVDGARLARRPADVREPARRQRRAVRALPVQAQQLQRDGRRPPAGRAHPRARGLHRRAERRPGQGLVPDRHRPVRGAPRHQRRQARGRHGDRGLASCSTAASTTTCPTAATARTSTASSTRSTSLGRAPDGARQQVRQRAWRASPATRAPPASSSTPATRTRPAASGGCATCDGRNDGDVHDRNQIAPPGAGGDRDALVGGILQAFLPGGRRRCPCIRPRRTATSAG